METNALRIEFAGIVSQLETNTWLVHLKRDWILLSPLSQHALEALLTLKTFVKLCHFGCIKQGILYVFEVVDGKTREYCLKKCLLFAVILPYSLQLIEVIAEFLHGESHFFEGGKVAA